MNSITESDKYKDVINKSLESIINIMLDINKDFLIVCDTVHIDFTPKLPDNIIENFNENVIFNIIGYTLETAVIDNKNNTFSFSAGFGQENFASTITIPLLGIKQIFLDDDIIFVNFTEPKKVVVDKSMNALLNNPENKRFIKKS